MSRRTPLDEEEQEMSCVTKACNCVSSIFWHIVKAPVIIVFGPDCCDDDEDDRQPLRTNHRIGTSQPPPQLRM